MLLSRNSSLNTHVPPSGGHSTLSVEDRLAAVEAEVARLAKMIWSSTSGPVLVHSNRREYEAALQECVRGNHKPLQEYLRRNKF